MGSCVVRWEPPAGEGGDGSVRGGLLGSLWPESCEIGAPSGRWEIGHMRCVWRVTRVSLGRREEMGHVR